MKKHYILISIAFLLMLPQILISFSMKHTIALLLLVLFIYILGVLHKYLFFIFLFFIDMTTVLILHIYHHWGGYGGNSIEPRIAVAYISPHSETIEYFNTYIDFFDITIFIYLLLVLISSMMFFKSYKFDNTIVYNIVLSLTALCIVFVLRNSDPIKIFKEINHVVTRNSLVRDRVNTQVKYQINVQQNRHLVYDKVIIVLGESANKNFLNLYGYHQNTTTPFLESIKKELFIFDAVSPSNQTIYSIPIYLTDADVHEFQQSYIESMSIIKKFQSVGYTVNWISNQGSAGKNDDMIRGVAQEADNILFFNEGKNYYAAKSDNVFVDYLNKHTLNNKKEVYFFHLMGSHFDYKKRYTSKIQLNKTTATIVQEYENTIYFTDYILKKIVNHFNKQNLNILVVYVSDHGELVTKKLHGHGFLPPYKDEYDVPFIVYSPTIYNKRVIKLQSLNDKKINLENFNSYILYMSYISSELNVSYNNDVFSLEPQNIFKYKKL